jgi:hypothetical protein
VNPILDWYSQYPDLVRTDEIELRRPRKSDVGPHSPIRGPKGLA